jgi:hypothetical protein
MATTLLSPGRIATLATAFYASEVAKIAAGTYDRTLPLSPDRATNAIAGRKDSPPKSRIIGLVAEAYYAGNGAAFPLPKSAAKGRKSLAAAILARREKGGRLGRWDVIRYSAEATLGRPVALSTVKDLYDEAGGDRERSYTGRGTRAAAPLTRGDEAAELEGSLG